MATNDERRDNPQPNQDGNIDDLFKQLLDEITTFQSNIINLVGGSLSGLNLLNKRLNQVSQKITTEVMGIDLDQLFDLNTTGTLGADLSSKYKQVIETGNRILINGIEGLIKKLDNAEKLVSGLPVSTSFQTYTTAEGYSELYKHFKNLSKEYAKTEQEINEIIEGNKERIVKTLNSLIGEKDTPLYAQLLENIYDRVGRNYLQSPQELPDFLSNIRNKLEEGVNLSQKEIKFLGEFFTTYDKVVSETVNNFLDKLVSGEINTKQLYAQLQELGVIPNQQIQNYQQFENIIRQIKFTRKYEDILYSPKYSLSEREFIKSLFGGIDVFNLMKEQPPTDVFQQLTTLGEKYERLSFGAEGFELLKNIPNFYNDLVNLRKQLIGNVFESFARLIQYGSLALRGFSDKAQELGIATPNLDELLNNFNNIIQAFQKTTESIEDKITLSPQDFTKEVSQLTKTAYEKLVEPFNKLAKTIENTLRESGLDKIVDEIQKGRTFTTKELEQLGVTKPTLDLVKSYQGLVDIQKGFEQAYLNIVGDISKFNLTEREKELFIARTGKYPDLPTAISYELIQPLKEGFRQLGYQLVSFGSMSLMFGLTNAFFMATTTFPMEVAYETYQPITYGIASFTGLPQFSQRLMSFAYQIPDLMENLYQQYISIKALTHSETQARLGIETGLQIARVEPIQFEEVMQIISSMSLYPELRKLITNPETQRKVFDIVQYLATLVPEQGVGGALFALREMFGGQFRSLQMRFNISPEFIAQMGGATWEEFKSATPDRMIEIMWKGLTNIFGGRGIFVEKGASFGIQLENIIDTLVNALIRPITLERSERIELTIKELGEKGLLQQLLPERYKYFTEEAKYYGLTSPEDVQRYATFRMMEIYGTPYGFLGLLGASFNNILNDILSQLNIGDIIGNFLLKVSRRILTTISEYRTKLEKVKTPEEAKQLALSFAKKFNEDIQYGIQQFSNILNSSELGVILSSVSDTIMKALTTTFQKVMEGIFINTLKVIADIPNMVGNMMANALLGNVSPSSMLEMGKYISTAFMVGMLMTQRYGGALGFAGANMVIGSLEDIFNKGGVDQTDIVKLGVGSALIYGGIRSIGVERIWGWGSKFLGVNSLGGLVRGVGAFGTPFLIEQLRNELEVEQGSWLSMGLDIAQIGIPLALAIMFGLNPFTLGALIIGGGLGGYHLYKDIKGMVGGKDAQPQTMYQFYSQLQKQFQPMQGIMDEYQNIFSSLFGEYSALNPYLNTKDIHLKEFTKGYMKVLDMLKNVELPYQFDIAEDVITYYITGKKPPTDVKNQMLNFFRNGQNVLLAFNKIFREYYLSPSDVNEVVGIITETASQTKDPMEFVKQVGKKLMSNSRLKGISKPIITELEKQVQFLEKVEDIFNQPSLPQLGLDNANQIIGQYLGERFKYQYSLNKYLENLVKGNVKTLSEIDKAIHQYYQKLEKEKGSELAISEVKAKVEELISSDNPLKVVKEIYDEIGMKLPKGISKEIQKLQGVGGGYYTQPQEGSIYGLANEYRKFAQIRKEVFGVALKKELEKMSELGIHNINLNTMDVGTAVKTFIQNLQVIFDKINDITTLTTRLIRSSTSLNVKIPSESLTTTVKNIQNTVNELFFGGKIPPELAIKNYGQVGIRYLNFVETLQKEYFGAFRDSISMASSLFGYGYTQLGINRFNEILNSFSQLPPAIQQTTQAFNSLQNAVRTLEGQFNSVLGGYQSIFKLGVATGVIPNVSQYYKNIYDAFSKLPPTYFLRHPQQLELYYKSALISGQPLTPVVNTLKFLTSTYNVGLSQLPTLINRGYAQLSAIAPKITQPFNNMTSLLSGLKAVDYSQLQTFIQNFYSQIASMSSNLHSKFVAQMNIVAQNVNIQTS